MIITFWSLMLSTVLLIDLPQRVWAQVPQFVGYVNTVQDFGLSNYEGCQALVRLQGGTDRVMVLATDDGICNLFVTGLETGYRILFYGEKMTSPPVLRPEFGAPIFDVYTTDTVILYNYQ